MSEATTNNDASTRPNPRYMRGTVRTNKMDKTVVVEVVQKVLDPRYKKYVRRRKRYMAHDEKNEFQPGDVVRIVNSRPLSHSKRWRVAELVERPK